MLARTDKPRRLAPEQGRVLIVEDEGIIAQDLKGRLTDWGYTVVGVAPSAVTAVELAVEHRPELVLMDIALRGAVDGIEAAARIGEALDTSIVYLTAFVDEETLTRAGATSPYGYLLKPFRERELQAVVELTIARHRAHRCADEAEQRSRGLARRLVEVREEEALRLSRRIHDELGQVLTALKFEVAWLRGRPEAARGLFNDRLLRVTELAGSAANSVREIAAELRPGVIDDLGLGAACEWAARNFTTRTGIECAVDAGASEIDPDPAVRIAAYRICQEALSNIERHADASRASIRLRAGSGTVSLRVRDDGRGMDRAVIRSKESIGLTSMRERAAAIGGRCVIVSRRGHGVCVKACLPTGPTQYGGPT